MNNLHKISPKLDIKIVSAIWAHTDDRYKYYKSQLTSGGLVQLKVKKVHPWGNCFGHVDQYQSQGSPPINISDVVIVE